MENPSSNASDSLNLSKGPTLKDNERGVHIIYVPTALIVGPEQQDKMGKDPVDPAMLAKVEKHIGQPQPTDIVVFAKEPWHFAGPQGQKHLRSHPQVHVDFPDTILVLSRSQHQQAVWWSETPFHSVTISPSGHASHAIPGYPEALTVPPPNPFSAPLAITIEHLDGRDLTMVRSTVPIPAADHHMYKIEFTIGGDPIDPDAYCTP